MFPEFPHRQWYEQRIDTMEDLDKLILQGVFPEEIYFRGMVNYDFICISSFNRQYLLNNKDKMSWCDQNVGIGVTMKLPEIDDEHYKALSFKVLDTFYSNLRDMGSKELSLNTISYLAQHYGLPTNLIDFSRDPKISLFFACFDEDKKFLDKDCTLYASDIHWHVKAMMPKYQTMGMGWFKHPTENRVLTDTEVDELMLKRYTTISKEHSKTVTPKIDLDDIKYTARIHNQDGVFVYHCDSVPFDRIMHTSVCNQSFGKVFVINKKLKPLILEKLEMEYGINKKYVYPDVVEDPNLDTILAAVEITKKELKLP